ncbi:MAG: hypothetical protein U0263_00705 [Polyangiaceae bacterium]
MRRPSVLVSGALLLASLLACKKSPNEVVDAECGKRYKGQPDLAQRVTLAQSCFKVYRQQTFLRDKNYNPRTRGKDGSAENETLHFSTVLGEIESVCGDASAKVEQEAGCKKLCSDVSDSRLIFPHFVVDADETKNASTSDLRGVCARNYGVYIPKESGGAAPSNVSVTE